MKKIITILRIIIAILLCYLAFMFFAKEMLSNYIIILLGINSALSAIDIYLQEKKNWMTITINLIIAVVLFIIYFSGIN